MSNSAFTVSGTGSVSLINTVSPIEGGPISSVGSISLADSGITPGTYTPASVTFDIHGLASSATALSSVCGENMIINGDMQVWQRGAGGTASFAAAANTTGVYTADRWQFSCEANQDSTVSQVAGATSGSYLAKIKRDAAQTGTGSLTFGTTLTRSMCIGAAGNFLTVSFKAKAGADFSPTNAVLECTVYSGTGSTDISDMSDSFVDNTAVLNEGFNLTSDLTNYSASTPIALPDDITQLSVQFVVATIGTAGVDDSFSITDVKLELGSVQTPFQRIPFPEQVTKCLPYFRKSFNYANAPAQNVGAATHEMLFAATIAGANGNVISKIIFEPPMLNAPNVTYYNPAAANALIRDITASVDFTTTTTQNADTDGITIIGIGNGATAAGDLCGIHYALDADLY